MPAENLICDNCSNIPPNTSLKCEICGVIFCCKKCLDKHKKNFDVALKDSKGWAD